MDRQAKAIGWEGDSRVGPSLPSEWPAPPHSLHQPPFQGKVLATSSAGCFCCKACAGRITCRLFLLRGLCRPLHLPAVCYNGLVVPCHALSACLCHGPMPAALVSLLPLFCFAFPPLFITMCARFIGQAARTALLAAATRDCICAAHAPFVVHCAHFKRGGLGLRVSSRPHSLSPA